MVPPSPPRSLHLILQPGDGQEGVRRVPLTEPVTLGPQPTNTFSIAGFSRRHTLITAHEGGHHLWLSEALDGTLTRGSSQRRLGTLWRPDGRLPLQPADRLVLTVGGVTLAVCFSADPPDPLPVAGQFRPRLLEPDAGPLLASLTLFATTIGALVLLASSLTIPERVSLSEIPDRFVTIAMQRPPPAPAEDPGEQRPPEQDAVADAIEPTGGQNGRLYGEAPRNLDQRLRDLIADQPEPGGQETDYSRQKSLDL